MSEPTPPVITPVPPVVPVIPVVPVDPVPPVVPAVPVTPPEPVEPTAEDKHKAVWLAGTRALSGDVLPAGVESWDALYASSFKLTAPVDVPPGTPQPAGDPAAAVTSDDLQISDATPADGEVTDTTWNTWFESINDEGKLPPAVRDEIKTKLKVSDFILDSLLGAKVAETEQAVLRQVSEAATAVGGKENLQAMMSWAAKALSQEQISKFNAGLRGDDSITHVLALKALFTDGQSLRQIPAEPARSIPTATGVSQPATTSFGSQLEMFKAMEDPRYMTDKAYREIVAAKIMAGQREPGVVIFPK